MLPATSQNTQPVSVLYGELTDREMQAIDSDGSTTPIHVNQPVWVIKYTNVPIPLLGPGANGTYQSTMYVFVDAVNGNYMFAIADAG